MKGPPLIPCSFERLVPWQCLTKDDEGKFPMPKKMIEYDKFEMEFQNSNNDSFIQSNHNNNHIKLGMSDLTVSSTQEEETCTDPEDLCNSQDPETQLISEPESVKIPQFIEEEVVIPLQEWTDDVVPVECADPLENEVVITLRSDEDDLEITDKVSKVTEYEQSNSLTIIIAELQEFGIPEIEIASEDMQEADMVIIPEEMMEIAEEMEVGEGCHDRLAEQEYGNECIDEIDIHHELIERDCGEIINEIEIRDQFEDRFGDELYNGCRACELSREGGSLYRDDKESGIDEAYEANEIEIDTTQSDPSENKNQFQVSSHVDEEKVKEEGLLKEFALTDEYDFDSELYVKAYNLRSRKTRPSKMIFDRLNYYERKRLWKRLLPAAKAFHEQSSHVNNKASPTSLSFTSEERSDEFMVDLLLSQTYGMEELDKITEYISVGDRSISDTIVSQVKSVIKTSQTLGDPQTPLRLSHSPSGHYLRSSNRENQFGLRRSGRSRKKPDKYEAKVTRMTRSRLDPMTFGQDTPSQQQSSPRIHCVTPPSDGNYYVITYPKQMVPDHCPMCYFKVFPCMFALNLVTNLATAKCLGCTLTMYIVQESDDESLPTIVFKSEKRLKSHTLYRPTPARYKRTHDTKKQRRICATSFFRR